METNPRNPLGSSSSTLSSYTLVQNEKDETEFYFLTENGSAYSLYFSDGSNYLPDEPFSSSVVMFGFDRIRRVRSKGESDPRIIGTIIKYLRAAFTRNPNLVVVFFCSQAGGLQRKRSQIFQDWFEKHSKEFVKVDYTDNEFAYVSAIFYEQHPYRREIEEKIREFTQDK